MTALRRPHTVRLRIPARSQSLLSAIASQDVAISAVRTRQWAITVPKAIALKHSAPLAGVVRVIAVKVSVLRAGVSRAVPKVSVLRVGVSRAVPKVSVLRVGVSRAVLKVSVLRAGALKARARKGAMVSV